MARFRPFPALFLGALVLVLAGCSGGNAVDFLFSGYRGFCWLIWAIFVVQAFVKIVNSNHDTAMKVLWAAAVFFFPVGGLIAWWIWGDKK